MNEKRDYYYRILGLQPGAKPSEIKTAYRRLVKFYHPDRDQSPDSETMYREICTAYKVLSEQPFASETGTEPVVYQYSPEWSTETSNQAKKTLQSTAESDSSSKQATWDSKEFDDWASQTTWDSENWEYYEIIPFELKNLLSIFWVSLKEIFNDNYFVHKVIPVLLLAFMSFMMPAELLQFSSQPHYNLAALFHIVSWIAVIIFRYYFVHYALHLKSLMRFVTGVLHGLILALVTACFYSVPTYDLIRVGFFSALSAWILLADSNQILNHLTWRHRGGY